MDADAYLRRISAELSTTVPSADVLPLLQRRHLLSIPFENLDIHWQRPIVLDTSKFYSKIIYENRGGFCYELNGLFNVLLRDLGFQTRLVSARVFNGTTHGPEYDHAAIIATVGDTEYLVDVGFGSFIAEPLRFCLDSEQNDETGVYVIRRFGDGYLEVAKKDDDKWISQYIFKDIPRELSEFSQMCDFQQFSPDSHFTKGKLCSIMTGKGRKTLTDEKFIVTADRIIEEIAVASDAMFDRLLKDEFGIDAS